MSERRPPNTERRLVGIEDVARMLGCSTRHIHRMRDAGRLPPAIRLGALVRWPIEAIERWIAEGCPGEPPRSTR